VVQMYLDVLPDVWPKYRTPRETVDA
jgi:hypothetical protein